MDLGRIGITVKHDSHIHEEVSLAKMSRLPPAFELGGIITAANASAVVDGAGAMLIATEQDAKKYDAKPLARIAGMGVAHWRRAGNRFGARSAVMGCEGRGCGVRDNGQTPCPLALRAQSWP
jgi:acetyl-CoA acetyltransferase